jgi:hypothetical protein
MISLMVAMPGIDDIDLAPGVWCLATTSILPITVPERWWHKCTSGLVVACLHLLHVSRSLLVVVGSVL